MGFKKVAIGGQLADIDIKLLRVFKAVVDANGVTSAETTLNLANSTITNYLSDLEKRLDMRLCERGRKGFNLTRQGQLVYDASLELLSAMQKFRTTINDSHQLLKGDLHLMCAEHTLGMDNYCIVNTLDEFLASAPNVNIKVSVMEANIVVGAINSGQADIGITVPIQDFAPLQAIDLFSEQMLLYCSRTHPLFTKSHSEIKSIDLTDYKFVESPRLRAGQEPYKAMKEWNIVSQAHHQEARMSLIMSGHFLGYLPSQLVSQWGVNDQLKPILAEKYGYINTFKSLSSKSSNNKPLIELFNSVLIRNLSKG